MCMKIKLKEVRNLKDLTQSKLSELTGVSKSEISRIERGESSPTMDQMEYFATALGVKINDLFESKHK